MLPPPFLVGRAGQVGPSSLASGVVHLLEIHETSSKPAGVRVHKDTAAGPVVATIGSIAPGALRTDWEAELVVDG